MKSATLPSLRVDPELHRAVESVLQEGESFSSFMELALLNTIEHRQASKAFLARGLASREEARQSGEYYSADSVLQDLDQMLAQAEASL